MTPIGLYLHFNSPNNLGANRFCFAFAFVPQKHTKNYAYSAGYDRTWQTFIVSKTRLVILLKLETSRLDLNNNIRLDRGLNMGRACTNY